MVEYWNCGELPWPDIEEFVDQNVGEALKFYILEEGVLMICWGDEPEPPITFTTSRGEFDKKGSLYQLLIDELGMHRPGGENRDDLFYDPEGDRRVILLQELLRTYLKWKEGGVHQKDKQ